MIEFFLIFCPLSIFLISGHFGVIGLTRDLEQQTMILTSYLRYNWDSLISNCHLKKKPRELMQDWDVHNQPQVEETGEKPPLWLRPEENKHQNKNVRKKYLPMHKLIKAQRHWSREDDKHNLHKINAVSMEWAFEYILQAA